MAVLSDNFDRSNESPLSSPWTTLQNAGIYLDTNKVRANSSSAYDASYYTGATWDDDQISEVELTAQTTINYTGCIVRAYLTGGINYYSAQCDGQNVQAYYLQKHVNGSESLLRTIVGANNRSLYPRMRINVSGTTIVCQSYVSAVWTDNGLSVTDSSHTSGAPGIRDYKWSANTYYFDNWYGTGASIGHPTISRWGGVPFMAVNKGVW